MAPSASDFAQRILSRTAVVGVVGLGYVGLPLVRVFVEAGFRVLGFDTDAAKVAQLAAGRSYISHIPSEWITAPVRDGRFEATADRARLAERGAQLSYNDPQIRVLPKMRHFKVPPLESRDLSADFLAGQDCILIATDHSAYDYEFIVRHAQLVVDTRNATRNVARGREKICKA